MRIYFLPILFIFLFVGCQRNSTASNADSIAGSETLTVSAAVSLKDAFHEIGEIYKIKKGRAITFNFGASGVLQKQIETGAPVDVFASSGEKQMDELENNGLIEQATRRDFARNSLVLIVPTDAKILLASFSDLAKPEIQKIAVGNPKTVPAGEYSEQLFEKLNLKESLQAKLILAENARQALDYVARGETDAGIVYATDARIAGEKIRIAVTSPENAHAPILYPIAVVKDSKNKPVAREFVELVLSAEGQGILQKYGFTAVSGK